VPITEHQTRHAREPLARTITVAPVRLDIGLIRHLVEVRAFIRLLRRRLALFTGWIGLL